MRHPAIAVLFAAAFLTPLAMCAEAADSSPAAKKSNAAASRYTEGEVRRIDKGAGKITLRHGPLRNLGMPAMTMVYRIKDPTVLEKLKVGDKVRFVADKVNGAYTVISIEPAT